MADDFSELMELAADLTSVPAEGARRIKSALEFTSINLRDGWRQGATVSSGYPSSYAAAISYDLKHSGGAIESEIGPVIGKTPGAGFGMSEEGGGGFDGPPNHAGRNAMEANEADFYRGLEIAAADALADQIGAL